MSFYCDRKQDKYFNSAVVSMSISHKRFSAWLIFAGILLFAPPVCAQVDAVIKISSPESARIEGRFFDENSNQSNKNWSFLNSIVGVENLGARISDFKLFDGQGQTVSVKKLIDGEYLAEGEGARFSYQINLKSPPDVKAKAHVSFIDNETGLLMLGDLLPQIAFDKQDVSSRIRVELPVDWKIISGEKFVGANAFEVKDIEKAIFLLGKNWRTRKIQIGKTELNLTISGEWQFSDDEAAQMAKEIFAEHEKLFGASPVETAQIFLMRFPPDVKFGRWEAETRGSNVVVFSADMPFKTQSLQRLHEQLRHEIFHLWMPNNLALTGNYDWFYEGFTIYQALRTGVAVNQIRFEDFLATLAEAYNADNRQNEKISLVEAAKNNRSGTNNRVYARGMLAAFLCDVAILRRSKGKKSIADVFRQVYQKHRVPHLPENGSAAVLKILQSYAELDLVIEKYIAGTEKINWKMDLESIGVEEKAENFGVQLSVKTKPNGRQKDLLNELGYNNWRKISGKGK